MKFSGNNRKGGVVEAGRPLLASGKIVSDYRLLMEYWRIAKTRGRSDLLKSEYFDRAIHLVERRGERVSADDLVRELADTIRGEIDVVSAVEAIRRLSNCGECDVSPVEAVEKVARALAGYVLEFLDTLGRIRIVGKEG